MALIYFQERAVAVCAKDLRVQGAPGSFRWRPPFLDTWQLKEFLTSVGQNVKEMLEEGTGLKK
jgi:hypothetical protein